MAGSTTGWIIRGGIALAAGLCASVALALYGGGAPRWALLFGVGAAVFAAAWCAYPRSRARSRGDRALRWTFAAAFGLCVALGHALQARDALLSDPATNAETLAIALGMAAGCRAVIALLPGRGEPAPLRPSACDRRGSRRAFGLALLALAVSWAPAYLAYYPGVYAYDVNNQATQCLTGAYDTQHPLLHTLFLKAGYLLGAALHNLTLGVGLMTLTQLLLTALGLASAVAFARRRAAPRWACAAVTAFFALLPVFPVMAVSTTKDALFGTAFLLSLLSTYDFLESRPGSPEARRAAWRAGGWMALAILLRNNALYAYGFAAAVGFAARRGRRRWRPAGLIALAAAVAVAGSAGLTAALHADSHTGVYEMLTLPAQQLRRAQRAADNPADREAIDACFLQSVPMESGYQPTFGDIARFSLNTTVYGWNDPTVDIPVNPDQILSTWLRMAPKYPLAYLEAFLQTNRGSWFPDDSSHATVYGPAGHGVGYLATTFNDTSDTYPVARQSLWPGLADALSALLSDNDYQRVPVLSRVLNTGFQVWLFFLGALACVLRRRGGLALVCLMPLGLWLTLLLGPCTLVRYVYPFFLLNPLLLTLAALPGAGENARGKRAVPNRSGSAVG